MASLTWLWCELEVFAVHHLTAQLRVGQLLSREVPAHPSTAQTVAGEHVLAAVVPYIGL